MNKVPSFKLYGADDPEFDNRIQPKLPLRSWGSLNSAEKQIALLKLRNEGFFSGDPSKVMEVIIQLNNRYLRLHPGKNMLYLSQGKSELQAGIEDFEYIFSASTCWLPEVDLFPDRMTGLTERSISPTSHGIDAGTSRP